MTATLTLDESFVSDMDWEATEVRVEEMEWEPSYIQVSEPMDWEDIPQVRASKRSKVSEPVIINVSLQDEAVPPQPKKVSSPLELKPNLSFQVKLTSPTPKQVSPLTSEFIRHKIRSKPKVSIPEVSAPNDRVILKAKRPAPPRI
ncbi:hypothetical protein TNIN_437881 [Trichonephila inaurata madagascariensis]|uniref:Uncharacterized protein n=1 Tax=Trichonephila inaurata madagascariensis TaxID=2747483 RepID=A0A8X6IK88_9ARAC|nr:hypothetical protein TNIN_437881 [Trichonephila inaurata madagascariensis]